MGLNLRRAFVGGERGVFPYLLATLPVPCLLVGWGLWKWKRRDAAAWFLGLWLAGGLLFWLLSSYAPSRYYVLFLPALAGLAAQGLAGMRRPAQTAARRRFSADKRLLVRRDLGAAVPTPVGRRAGN